MSARDVSIVLVRGAWADGSSWAKVIAPLSSTSFANDVTALDLTLECVIAPGVFADHTYAGAVIGAMRSEKVKALVDVAAPTPNDDETVADVFYHAKPHPLAPKLSPEIHGLIHRPRRHSVLPSRKIPRRRS